VAGVKISAEERLHTSLTDDQGRFEIFAPPNPRGWGLTAQPESGQPYFAATVWVAGRPGAGPVAADIDLVSGIPLHGQVTDQATGRPPRAAEVEYYPLFPNAHSGRLTNSGVQAASSSVVGADGSFCLAVLPGPGVVCVAASPRDAYAAARIDGRELDALFNDGTGRRGRGAATAVGEKGQGILWEYRYHALSLINPNEGANSPALDIALHPARPLRGTVAGPDGRPLTGLTAFGLTAVPDEEKLGGASFTVRGLNPREVRHLVFQHPGRSLGKLLTVPGDRAEPLAVRLEPCGSVVGRTVDKGGKPVPGVYVQFGGEVTCLGAQAETDPQGRFRVALVPGQRYWARLLTTRPLLRPAGDVEVEPGRVKDLGDMPLGD
jgi:hypothetical protein